MQWRAQPPTPLRRHGSDAATIKDQELKELQKGEIDGDALEAWKRLKAEGKVQASDSMEREAGDRSLGGEGLIAERIDEKMPYIDSVSRHFPSATRNATCPPILSTPITIPSKLDLRLLPDAHLRGTLTNRALTLWARSANFLVEIRNRWA